MIGEPPNRLGLAVQLSLADERQASAEEGAKDRACAPVSAAIKEAGRWIVVVVSITRSPPIDAAAAIEISAATNVRLGLGRDGPGLSAAKRVCSLWPGQHRRPAPGRSPASVWYGPLPPKLNAVVRAKSLELARTRRLKQSCGAIGQGRGGTVMSRPRMRPYPAALGGQCGRGRGQGRGDRARVA
jgi:hypothetical protein